MISVSFLRLSNSLSGHSRCIHLHPTLARENKCNNGGIAGKIMADRLLPPRRCPNA